MKLIKHYDFTTLTKLDKDFTIATGDKWANNEQQIYTDHPNNIFFDNGLVLKATKENDIIKSARIHTKNNFSFLYGRIDIIAKVPKGKGTWPALWMMPQEDRYGHWPKSGEIDIMEHCGNDLNELFLCIHTEAYNHTREEQYYKTIHVDDLTDRFHKYSLLWEKNRITYLLNDKVITSYVKGEDGKDSSNKGWPFNHPYYLIMNLAIGGSFGGAVDHTMFPQEFIIKDVKIYQ